MKLVIGSDSQTELTKFIIAKLHSDHELTLLGALSELNQESEKYWHWPKISMEVAGKVASGEADEGILFCFTGTGASIAANKIAGARAALCFDAYSSNAARSWNDANILVMGLRQTSLTIASEIIESWFNPNHKKDSRDQECIDFLKSY